MTQFWGAAIASAGAFLFLAAGHFAIDRLRRRKHLHRLVCYVLGTSTIYWAFTIWALCYGHVESAIALGMVIVGAGLGTLASPGKVVTSSYHYAPKGPNHQPQCRLWLGEIARVAGFPRLTYGIEVLQKHR